MAYIRQVDPDDADGLVRQHYDAGLKRAGKIFNILRIQMERQHKGLFPSVREYHHLYGIDAGRLARMKPDVVIMHPGPINRGIEISQEVADGENSVILRQVRNGLAVRMAVLVLVQSAKESHGG